MEDVTSSEQTISVVNQDSNWGESIDQECPVPNDTTETEAHTSNVRQEQVTPKITTASIKPTAQRKVSRLMIVYVFQWLQ